MILVMRNEDDVVLMMMMMMILVIRNEDGDGDNDDDDGVDIKKWKTIIEMMLASIDANDVTYLTFSVLLAGLILVALSSG